MWLNMFAAAVIITFYLCWGGSSCCRSQQFKQLSLTFYKCWSAAAVVEHSSLSSCLSRSTSVGVQQLQLALRCLLTAWHSIWWHPATLVDGQPRHTQRAEGRELLSSPHTACGGGSSIITTHSERRGGFVSSPHTATGGVGVVHLHVFHCITRPGIVL